MRAAIDGVIVRQTAVDTKTAPLVEMDRCCVGCENVKIDGFAVVLFARREIRQQVVKQQ